MLLAAPTRQITAQVVQAEKKTEIYILVGCVPSRLLVLEGALALQLVLMPRLTAPGAQTLAQ